MRELADVSQAFGALSQSPGTPTPARPAPARTPAPKQPSPRTRAKRSSSPSASPQQTAGSISLASGRVYAHLTASETESVRSIAKSRNWTLLAVVGAALEQYTPDMYRAEVDDKLTSPVPGTQRVTRAGEFHVPISVAGAAQRTWLETALQPYAPDSISHLLGCALSHYLTTTDGKG